MSLRANFYLRGMRDRSMRSGTELARVQEEIEISHWEIPNVFSKLGLSELSVTLLTFGCFVWDV